MRVVSAVEHQGRSSSGRSLSGNEQPSTRAKLRSTVSFGGATRSVANPPGIGDHSKAVAHWKPAVASRSHGKGGICVMQRVVAVVLAMTFGGSAHAADDEHHSHPTPEKLGTVTFPTSC